MKKSITKLAEQEIQEISGGLLQKVFLDPMKIVLAAAFPVIGALGAYGIIRVLSKNKAG